MWPQGFVKSFLWLHKQWMLSTKMLRNTYSCISNSNLDYRALTIAATVITLRRNDTAERVFTVLDNISQQLSNNVRNRTPYVFRLLVRNEKLRNLGSCRLNFLECRYPC